MSFHIHFMLFFIYLILHMTWIRLYSEKISASKISESESTRVRTSPS